MKKLNLRKDCCLKSFDAKISGKLNGFIAAKVSFGNGGHQDNVFEEMDVLAQWWSVFQICQLNLIILIDTDLKDKFLCLRAKYEKFKNIFVFDHCEFQEFIISNYGEKVENVENVETSKLKERN